MLIRAMYLVNLSRHCLCLCTKVGVPTCSVASSLNLSTYVVCLLPFWCMPLHECFLPLHDPPHVATPHLEVHSLELRFPPLHANLAPSQGQLHRFLLIKFYIPSHNSHYVVWKIHLIFVGSFSVPHKYPYLSCFPSFFLASLATCT